MMGPMSAFFPETTSQYDTCLIYYLVQQDIILNFFKVHMNWESQEARLLVPYFEFYMFSCFECKRMPPFTYSLLRMHHSSTWVVTFINSVVPIHRGSLFLLLLHLLSPASASCYLLGSFPSLSYLSHESFIFFPRVFFKKGCHGARNS